MHDPNKQNTTFWPTSNFLPSLSPFLTPPKPFLPSSAFERPSSPINRYVATTSTAPAHHQLPLAFHPPSYYLICLLGGSLSCGITHSLTTPLDVIKCNIQTQPLKYPTFLRTFRTLLHEQGLPSIWKGLIPTAIGYSLQGTFKFGFYEFFKDFYSSTLTDLTSQPQLIQQYRSLIWCLSSASAEFLADIVLCPFEMTKIKIQTTPPTQKFPTAFLPAFSYMLSHRKQTRFPFGSLVPLWSRQIPYTVTKFIAFEKIVSLFYTYVFTNPKDSYGSVTQLGVTFVSGYIAGIFCAIVSQPADNIVSQLGKVENRGKSVRMIVKEVGWKDLMGKGIGTRILMVGSLTGAQWWIYDTFKTVMGLETTGGK